MIPVWIRLIKLPTKLLGMNSLSRISSLFGVPIATDSCTVNQSRVKYASKFFQRLFLLNMRKVICMIRRILLNVSFLFVKNVMRLGILVRVRNLLLSRLFMLL